MSHNSGRINWNLLHDSLKIQKCTHKTWYFDNFEPGNILHFVRNLLNIINEFSETYKVNKQILKIHRKTKKRTKA